MDQDMTRLAWEGASTVVALLATDAWEQAKNGLQALWHRVHPERSDAVGADLLETRASVLAARAAADQAIESGLVQEWQSRLRRILTEDPRLIHVLRTLLDDELVPSLPAADQTRIVKIKMDATASGDSRVYQAGRDQHIYRP